MDVIPPFFTLLNAADVSGQMVEDLIALNLPGQPVLILKDRLDTKPGLDHR
ncbi:hypothetical protein D3C84_1205200 [compost metagenome]